MQFLVTFSALVIAACAGFLTYWNVREHRNADLVKIGVSVLRVDPEKEKQISAAREWALNLIDADAGGVKFSPEARAQLIKKRLEFDGWGSVDNGWGSVDTYPKNPAVPQASPPPPQ